MPERPKYAKPLYADQLRSEPRRRPAWKDRLYGRRWKNYAHGFLLEHPLCIRCERAGRVQPANVVDHIQPHKGDENLFWDPGNHQSLCKKCHDRKTYSEDGGLGREGGANPCTRNAGHRTGSR